MCNLLDYQKKNLQSATLLQTRIQAYWNLVQYNRRWRQMHRFVSDGLERKLFPWSSNEGGTTIITRKPISLSGTFNFSFPTFTAIFNLSLPTFTAIFNVSFPILLLFSISLLSHSQLLSISFLSLSHLFPISLFSLSHLPLISTILLWTS